MIRVAFLVLLAGLVTACASRGALTDTENEQLLIRNQLVSLGHEVSRTQASLDAFENGGGRAQEAAQLRKQLAAFDRQRGELSQRLSALENQLHNHESRLDKIEGRPSSGPSPTRSRRAQVAAENADIKRQTAEGLRAIEKEFEEFRKRNMDVEQGE